MQRPILLFFSIAFAAAATAQDTTTVPANAPKSEPAQPLPAPTADEISRWLAGLPPTATALQSFALVPSWKQHARELDEAWAGSESER